jgi:hypothetical protein
MCVREFRQGHSGRSLGQWDVIVILAGVVEEFRPMGLPRSCDGCHVSSPLS